ncbi:MAG: cytochrome-c oxidase, cbb3-type subunit III [Candidatus Endonucleobacter bathymodioli]|uniref:Cbb3-type cytochrome c oxidase subunit n=1 Tax=Candidatus Endonucleibacter bathymodioli TaxID=539814 RepID=A0AA90NL00_9GAMM|nr:cytochrome-c oxidase, cbb3-type subunit III [Candidatus Endonucleobacter bathymodioli]
MSIFWSAWIIILTLVCLILVMWVLFATHKAQRSGTTNETTGHNYDGIEELDNPMPRWWFVLFVATLIFSAGYLLIYPGMGSWEGLLGWTSINEYERHQLKHDRRYMPEFSRYAATPIIELINNPKAIKMGQRIFMNNCTICHASDAGGNFGFPNLTNNKWLYGGAPETIKTTILHGRKGQMPAWGAIIGEKGVNNVTHYVRSLSNLTVNADDKTLEAGKKVFNNTCSICHGGDAKGNTLLGAPDLTSSDNWLYGSSHNQVAYTIRNGRNGIMSPWKDILGEEKVHLVTAYIYSLNNKAKKPEKQ